MADRIHNILLLTFIGCLLFAVLGTKWTSNSGAEYPEWMHIGLEKTSLEGRKYTEEPKINRKSLADGSYQEQCESYLSDIVPMRDNIVLANASMQRQCIRVANIPFSFDAYPTFFNSGTSVVPEHELIVPNATSPTDENTKAASEFVALVDELALSHPEVRFCYQALRSPYDSEFNPTYRYVSHVYDMDWVNETILDPLKESGNVTLLYEPIRSFDEYKELWITTEHHWTIERALIAYNHLADSLDWTIVPYDNPKLIVASWYGARCRLGLDLEYSSEFYDLVTDFSSIEWKNKKGETVPCGKRDEYLTGSNPYSEKPIYNVYDSYYGSSNLEALNHGDNNGKTCLVICSSYTKALKNHIASNYKRTIFVDPMNGKATRSMSDYIENEDVDDVVIQIASTSYGKLKQNSPDLLS
ncbi:MAG: hypothetical protein ACOYIP_05735 [Coriobacteriales bacterium]|jgi:hypothetical protein